MQQTPPAHPVSLFVLRDGTFFCEGAPIEGSTFYGSHHRCEFFAVDFGQLCVTVKRTEGRHCTAAGEATPPGRGGGMGQGHRGIVGVKGGCPGIAVALDSGCRGNVEVQAQGRGRGWLEELSSGRFDMFVGSRFPPHGGSSARRGCRTGG